MKQKVKIINDYNGQLVILPEICRMECDEVLTMKVGNSVILVPNDDIAEIMEHR